MQHLSLCVLCTYPATVDILACVSKLVPMASVRELALAFRICIVYNIQPHIVNIIDELSTRSIDEENIRYFIATRQCVEALFQNPVYTVYSVLMSDYLFLTNDQMCHLRSVVVIILQHAQLYKKQLEQFKLHVDGLLRFRTQSPAAEELVRFRDQLCIEDEFKRPEAPFTVYAHSPPSEDRCLFSPAPIYRDSDSQHRLSPAQSMLSALPAF